MVPGLIALSPFCFRDATKSMIRPRAIAPDIALFPSRTPTLPPATHTNSYALGRREVLLVEPATPYDDERIAWMGWAHGMLREGRKLLGIFATHHHIDHASGIVYFAQALGLPVFAHPLTFARLNGLEGLDAVDCVPIEDGRVFALDSASQRWTALHTPGHARGHLCLHDAQAKTLIVGDMVANGSTILIPPDDGGDMAVYLEQLRRLDALQATLMLPAHGDPLDDPHATLTHYLAHRAMREEKVLHAYRSLASELGRAPTIREMIPRAYDDTPMHLWPIAEGALEAHWIKLRDEARL
ncbi:MAG: MBL fold metallo-hydrolase [Polyangiales bacterium]